MRKPIIAGNWKMNKTPQEAAELIAELKTLVKDASAQVVVCVPAVDIPAAVQAVRGSKIKVGAQNVHFKESGAYTGELSAGMLKACKVDYVIIGHSERRQYFGETDETVNLRTLAAVKAGLIPIVCVGEKKEQREAGYTDDLVTYQTLTALTGLTKEEVAKVVIAYEPVWSIGPGKTPAGKEYITKVARFVKEVTGGIDVVYGGGLKADNAEMLASIDEIDGGLIALTCFSGEIGFYPDQYAEIIALYLGK